jgi:hypothetical protein
MTVYADTLRERGERALRANQFARAIELLRHAHRLDRICRLESSI